jgi:HEAT repeat protein
MLKETAMTRVTVTLAAAMVLAIGGLARTEPPTTRPAASSPASSPATQSVEKTVAELISQLGQDNYKVRQAATANLIQMGKAIHGLLNAKLQEKDLDPEVAARIQIVLGACRRTQRVERKIRTYVQM